MTIVRTTRTRGLGVTRGGRAPVAVLICVLVLPSLLLASQLATSMAIGTVLAAVIAAGAASMRGIALPRLVEALRKLPWIVVAILAHLGLSSQVVQIDGGRAIGSLILLGLTVACSGALADLLTRSSARRIARMTYICLYALLAFGLCGSLGVLQPFAGHFTKPVFPFTEPSHFALLLTPFLIFACVTAQPRKRVLYIAAVLAETAMLQNLTLAVGCMLAAILCLRMRHLLLVLALIVPAVSLLDLSYYLDRLQFSGEVQNLSTLVYLQGWQSIGESWDLTYGIGRGFQQLGVFGTGVPAAELIRSILGTDLNLFDGGFMLSKILSEFGVVGALLVAGYVIVAIRAASLLRSAAAGRRNVEPLEILVASVIVGYSIELLLRGAGYFTPTGLLLLASLWIWRRRPAPRATRVCRPLYRWFCNPRHPTVRAEHVGTV